MAADAHALLGKPVLNGCGSLLGSVVEVLATPDGDLGEIVVRQADGCKEWIVEAVHIKRVAEQVLLKGPREGFHIAPLPPAPPARPARLR